MLHPAPTSTRHDVEQVIECASKCILRFLQRRRIVIIITTLGEGEVTVITKENQSGKWISPWHPYFSSFAELARYMETAPSP
jgi:hypothetical protein